MAGKWMNMTQDRIIMVWDQPQSAEVFITDANLENFNKMVHIRCRSIATYENGTVSAELNRTISFFTNKYSNHEEVMGWFPAMFRQSRGVIDLIEQLMIKLFVNGEIENCADHVMSIDELDKAIAMGRDNPRYGIVLTDIYDRWNESHDVMTDRQVAYDNLKYMIPKAITVAVNEVKL